MKKQTSIMIDKDLLQKIKDIAQKNNRSISFTINEAIKNYINLKCFNKLQKK